MGTYHQRLGIAVTNTADTAVTMKFCQILIKLGTERGILNGMDLTLKTILFIENDHSGSFSTKMGVIVHSEENVERNVPF